MEENKKTTPIAVKRIKRQFFELPKEELKGVEGEDRNIRKKNYEKGRRMSLNEEITVLQRLQKTGCPNVIKFYGVANGDDLKRVTTFDGQDFDELTLVFEFCPLTLASRIRSGLSEYECHKFMKDIVNGVRALYDLGYAHRDIKPENILIRVYSDGREEAVLTDFGFAKPLTFLNSDGCCGTPGYMAPEVKENEKNSPLMDIYSLGMTMWSMLTGMNYPSKKKPETADLEFVTLPNLLRCDVTNSCWETVKYMLMKKPEHRMTYEELWNNRWLNSSDEELAECYERDRMACLDHISLGEKSKWSESKKSEYQNKVRKINQLYRRLLWPTEKNKKDGQNPREKKEEPDNRKAFEDALVEMTTDSDMKIIREQLQEEGASYAREASSCESVLGVRSISEYKVAIIYLSIALRLCPKKQRPFIATLVRGLSGRISMLESQTLIGPKSSSA